MNIVSITDHDQLGLCFKVLISLILDLLENSFKEVKAKSCKCISVLCRSNPQDIIGHGPAVIDSLILCLKHPDFKVRSSALEALGQFLYTAPSNSTNSVFEYILSHKSDSFHEVIQFSRDNVFSNMIRDEDVQVRDMFYRITADWIMHLPGKHQYDNTLVPIILVGLFDPIEEVRETCWEQIGEIGMTWENENYTLVPTEPDRVQTFKPYPWHPFLSRPRFGVRRYFESYFTKSLSELLKEIGNFMSPHRELSVKLLLSLLILSESISPENVTRTITSLMRALQATDHSEFTTYVFSCLEVLGRQVDFTIYFPVISESRTKPSIFCTILCISTPVVSVFSQISTLTYLVKGALQRDHTEIPLSFASILKFVNKFERSTETLLLAEALIDHHTSWSQSSTCLILKLLLEHDHKSVPIYLNKLKDFPLFQDPSNFVACASSLISEISGQGSGYWKSHNLSVIHIQWPVFANLCKYCCACLAPEELFQVFEKIFHAANSPYHIPAIRLMKHLKFYSVEVVNKLVLRCLSGSWKTKDVSQLRLEALQLLRMSEHRNVEMPLFQALSLCLDDPLLNVQVDSLDELHRQFTFVKIYGVESFTRAKDQSSVVTKLMLKLISMLDREEDSTHACLHPLIDVIGLFPEEIDMNAKAWSQVLGTLVRIVMNEENLRCKELAHLCIIAVTNSSKTVILEELNNIGKNADEKTKEYIQCMLSSE